MKILLIAVLLVAPSSAQWKPLPNHLWAPQAVVPPGTTGAGGALIVPTGAPSGVEVRTGGEGPLPPGLPVSPRQLPPGVPNPGANIPSVPIPGVPIPGVPVPAIPIQGVPNPGVPSPGGAGRSSQASPSSQAPSSQVPSSQASPSQASPGVPSPPAAADPARVKTADAPTASTTPACDVLLRVTRMDLPHEGGNFVLPAILEPPRCPASVAFTSTWLKLTDPAELRFAVEPNTDAGPRDALIVLGQQSFFVRQAPPPQPGLAAAPSHLVFGVNRKGEASTQMLTAWSDLASAEITVRAAHPWLTVTPAKSKKDRKAYEVTIQPDARLMPGRYDSQIEITSTGAPGKSILIPVVVEAVGRDR